GGELLLLALSLGAELSQFGVTLARDPLGFLPLRLHGVKGLLARISERFCALDRGLVLLAVGSRLAGGLGGGVRGLLGRFSGGLVSHGFFSRCESRPSPLAG